jgi:hypothetical protein
MAMAAVLQFIHQSWLANRIRCNKKIRNADEVVQTV